MVQCVVVFTCPCQQVNHGSLSAMLAYSVTCPFDFASLQSTFHTPKIIFRQMLAMREQKSSLERWVSELSKCLTVLSDARSRRHWNQTNVCGGPRCTDLCGFEWVWSSVLWKLHGLGLAALADALPVWLPVFLFNVFQLLVYFFVMYSKMILQICSILRCNQNVACTAFRWNYDTSTFVLLFVVLEVCPNGVGTFSTRELFNQAGHCQII